MWASSCLGAFQVVLVVKNSPGNAPADLIILAAVIGCGAWEAQNPRPLFVANVENSGSGSRGGTETEIPDQTRAHTVRH